MIRYVIGYRYSGQATPRTEVLAQVHRENPLAGWREAEFT